MEQLFISFSTTGPNNFQTLENVFFTFQLLDQPMPQTTQLVSIFTSYLKHKEGVLVPLVHVSAITMPNIEYLYSFTVAQ